MAMVSYLCIGCPLGCRLEVEDDDGRIVEIRGHQCKRGKEFARQEHRDPRRMLTTTVRIENGLWPKLPVKTSEPIPKDKVVPLCKELHKLRLRAPVRMGDVIMTDGLKTGIDVVATRDMPEA